MIVRWPGKVKAGTLSEQVWTFWDVLPTVADIAGASLRKTSTGRRCFLHCLVKNRTARIFFTGNFTNAALIKL